MTENLRSKNSFDFESSDNKFPYGIQSGVPIGKRNHIVFNYSSVYFRRKLGGGNGLYFIDGGNIPSDMADSVTLESSKINTDDDTQVVTCSALKGSAVKIAPPTSTGTVPYSVLDNNAPTVINLAPSTLLKLAKDCDEPPKTSEEILYEKAKQFKPNSLYPVTFQNSASTHPRAKGFAGEDVYSCLKLINTGGNYNVKDNGVCCDFFAIPFRTRAGGAYTLEEDYGSDPPTFSLRGPFGTTFSCGDYNESSFNCPEAGNRCHFGFYLNVGEIGITPDAICEEIEGYAPMQAWYTVTYLAGGNLDCGCSGFGGTVTLNSVMSCKKCSYIQIVPNPTDPIGSIDKEECESQNATGQTICEIIFNKQTTIGGKDVYFTTLSAPSFSFPDGQRLEITDGGTLRPIGCGGNILLDCNDVN